MTMTIMPFDPALDTPSGPGTSPTPLTGTTPTAQSAKGLIDSFLAAYGLQSLGSTAWQWYLQGQSSDQILLNLRGTPEYQSRFPAMADLSKRGQAITEGDYINYERAIQAQNRAAGIPQGMYDTPDDIKNLLLNNVSASEYQARVQAYQTAAWQTPPEVRQALTDYYGVTPGQLTAFFIDPDRALPLIQRDLASAQAEGTSVRTGFGQLGQAQAEHLADLNLSPDQLNTGFNKLSGLNQLVQGLPGQQGVGTTTALQAQFDQNAQAQQALEAAQAAEVGRYKQGGRPASSAQGVLGAGSTT